MSENDLKVIRQKNGEIVMSALRTLHEPSTLTSIVKFVSDTQQMEREQIKEPVLKVLETGVKYGFLKKHGMKYSVDASDEDVDEEVDDEEMQDRSSRRRHSKSRGKSSSRSRTRSRSRSQRCSSKKRKR